MLLLGLAITTASAHDNPLYLKCTADNGYFDRSHGGKKERHFKIAAEPKKVYYLEQTSRKTNTWIDADKDADDYVLAGDEKIHISNVFMLNGREVRSSDTQIILESGEFFVYYEFRESMDRTRFLHGRCSSSSTAPTAE